MSDAQKPQRTRRAFTAEQKPAVRRHLADKATVSDLADELDIQPSQTHPWGNHVLQQAERAFERSGNGRRDDTKIARLEAKIAQKEAKLVHKNEVISELLEERVQLEKFLALAVVVG